MFELEDTDFYLMNPYIAQIISSGFDMSTTIIYVYVSVIEIDIDTDIQIWIAI